MNIHNETSCQSHNSSENIKKETVAPKKSAYDPYERSAIFQVFCMRLNACQNSLQGGIDLPENLYNQMAILVGHRSSELYKSHFHKVALDVQPLTHQAQQRAIKSLNTETDKKKINKLRKKLDQGVGPKSVLNIPAFKDLLQSIWQGENAGLGKRSLDHLFGPCSEDAEEYFNIKGQEKTEGRETAKCAGRPERVSPCPLLSPQPNKAQRSVVPSINISKHCISEDETTDSMGCTPALPPASLFESLHDEIGIFNHIDDMEPTRADTSISARQSNGRRSFPGSRYQKVTGEQIDELLCELIDRPSSNLSNEPEEPSHLLHETQFSRDLELLCEQERILDLGAFSPARESSGIW